MTSKIVVNNIESDTGIATITISSPVNLSGGTTGGVTVGTGASISSPATNVLTISTNNSERIRVGAAGSIGIGTDNPQKLIDISGSATGITTTGRLQIHPHVNGFDIVSTAGDIAPHYQSLFALYTGQSGSGTLRWRVDSSGRVTMPYQPAFMVRGDGSGSKASNDKFNFLKTPNTSAQVCFDRANNWSDDDDRFTAPVSGVYHFIFGLYRQSATSSFFSMAPRVNGNQLSIADSFIFFTAPTGETGNTDDGMYGSFYMNLSAGDYVELFMRSGASTISWYASHSFFGGHLVG